MASRMRRSISIMVSKCIVQSQSNIAEILGGSPIEAIMILLKGKEN